VVNLSNLKIVNKKDLKDWAEEIFKKNTFNMVDVSAKKETYRRALASGKYMLVKRFLILLRIKKCQKEIL